MQAESAASAANREIVCIVNGLLKHGILGSRRVLACAMRP